MGGYYIVTGGNRGIGLSICRGLSALGGEVVLVCRDVAQGEGAVASFPGPGGGRVVQGDLGSLDGAKALGEALLALDRPIAALIHNAGIWPTARILSPEGFEESFVVNHLSPLLLNHLLFDRLATDGARVVQMTAGLYVAGRYDAEKTPTGADFSQLRTYATTKLANLLATLSLAERWGGRVPIHGVHPGVIRTGLGSMEGPLGWLLALVKRLWKTPEYGARAPIFLATDQGLARRTGLYFNEMAEAPLEGPALDGGLRAMVWDQAVALIKPHLPKVVPLEPSTEPVPTHP